MDAEQPWPGEWLRGVLEVCVLRILTDGPTYGYAIATRLADSGLGVVKGGTLYPLLARLETSGFVAIEWRAGEGGPGRKYYQLTGAGRAELDQSAERWAEFARLTMSLVADADGEAPYAARADGGGELTSRDPTPTKRTRT